jgi:hypothetical protein
MNFRGRILACSFLGTFLLASSAHAYCWSTTCDEDDHGTGLPTAPQGCNAPSDQCKPLHWPRLCVGYSLQIDGSRFLTPEQAERAVSEGFSEWVQPMCNGEPPSIMLQQLIPVQCDQVEYNKDAGNANVVIFRDDEWPHEEFEMGRTTVTFDPFTGEIQNADMELNMPAINAWGGDIVEIVQAIVAHEAGHFFGMDDVDDGVSTMNWQFLGPTIANLSPGDEEGMCALYPPFPMDRSQCNPIPHHGFAVACGEDQPPGGCATDTGRKSPGGILLVAVMVGLMGLLRRLTPSASRPT